MSPPWVSMWAPSELAVSSNSSLGSTCMCESDVKVSHPLFLAMQSPCFLCFFTGVRKFIIVFLFYTKTTSQVSTLSGYHIPSYTEPNLISTHTEFVIRYPPSFKATYLPRPTHSLAINTIKFPDSALALWLFDTTSFGSSPCYVSLCRRHSYRLLLPLRHWPRDPHSIIRHGEAKGRGWGVSILSA